MRQRSKLIKELNEILSKDGIIKVVNIEKYQDPHNYLPSARLMTHLDKEQWETITLDEIKKYEKEFGPSCAYPTGTNEPCKLLAQEHVMKQGIVVMAPRGTDPVKIAEQVLKIYDILNRNDIEGISLREEDTRDTDKGTP